MTDYKLKLIKIITANVKLTIKKSLLLLPILFIFGCSTVELTPDFDLKKVPVERVIKNMPQKRIIITAQVNVELNSILSKVISNARNANLDNELVKSLQSPRNFASVKIKPTQVELLSDPAANKADVDVEVVVGEKYTYEDPVYIYLLRAITFGVYPQTVRKHYNVNYKIHDNKSNKQVDFTQEYDAEYKYRVPFLIIPLNLDTHPFFAKIHIQNDLNMTLPTISEMLTPSSELVLK